MSLSKNSRARISVSPETTLILERSQIVMEIAMHPMSVEEAAPG